MASIFTRGKRGIWWIKYYVDGKQVYRSLDTTEPRVALRAKREVEGEHAKGQLLAPSRTALAPFLQEYCEFLITIRTHKSYKNDLSVLRVFFGPVCPALTVPGRGSRDPVVPLDAAPEPPPDPLKEIHVRVSVLEEVTSALIEQFIARRCREEAIAPKTANRCREVLHRMFRYAIDKRDFVAPDRRQPNPAARVERRPEPARTIRFLSLEQIQEQLDVLQEHPVVQTAAAIMIYAGLRREEATWLRPEDCDEKRRLIHVRAKTIDGVFWQPKTKRNRVVPVSDALLAILQEHRKHHSGSWILPSPQGRRWDPDNFSHALRAINKSAKLQWSALDFRHTFGSHLAQKGESLYKIATLMGNSPEICRRHYAALIPETMHDVVEFIRPHVPAGLSPVEIEEVLRQLLARLRPAIVEQPLRLAQ